MCENRNTNVYWTHDIPLYVAAELYIVQYNVYIVQYNVYNIVQYFKLQHFCKQLTTDASGFITFLFGFLL